MPLLLALQGRRDRRRAAAQAAATGLWQPGRRAERERHGGGALARWPPAKSFTVVKDNIQHSLNVHATC